MLYDRTCKMIYDMASYRVRYRKKLFKVHSSSIAPSEPSVLSAIISRKLIPNKNPYLIPGRFICPLVEELRFDTEQELLFGSDKEIISYVDALFESLIYDTLDEETPEFDKRFLRGMEKSEKLSIESNFKTTQDQIYNALLGYIPLAVYRAIQDTEEMLGMDLSDELLDPQFFKIYNEEVYPSIFSSAISWLYQSRGNRLAFLTAFKQFVDNHNYFEDLNRDLYLFVKNDLVKIIDPGDSPYNYGNKIYNILIKAYDEYSTNMLNSEVREEEADKYLRSNLSEANTYAYRLKLIQDKIDKADKVHVLSGLQNKWSEQIVEQQAKKKIRQTSVKKK